MPKPVMLGPAGLQLLKVEDPTGNAQESYDVVSRESGSDVFVYSRVIFQRHAGGKIRVIHAGPWAGTEEVFEVGNDGKTLIVEV